MLKQRYLVGSAEMYKAILLYVYWQISNPHMSKDDIYAMNPTNAYLEQSIRWRRCVMRSVMGNDTFILNGR